MAYNKQQLQKIIDEAAQRHGVNGDQLKIIAGIESSYNPDAVGAETRSGRAQGLFQFTPATAKGYGIKNPKDPVEAADGAARYWKDLSKQFNGELPLMIAQYNGGNSGSKAAKSGKVFEETAGYYNKFNKKAKELGLNSFIQLDDYAVIPRQGYKKTPAQQEGSVTPQHTPETDYRNAPSFLKGEQDIRESTAPTNDDRGTQQLRDDYADENRTYGEAIGNFGKAAVEGAYVGNYAAQGINFVRQSATGPKQGNEGWAEQATDDYILGRLKESEVPSEGWDFILQGVNDRDTFNMRMNMAQESQRAARDMGKSPAGALVGALVGGVLDPTFWLSGGAGALAAAGRTARVAKIAAGAVAGAATDAVIGDVVGRHVDAQYDNLDIVINAAGGSIGGVIGSFAKGSHGARAVDPTEGKITVSADDGGIQRAETPQPLEAPAKPQVQAPREEAPIFSEPPKEVEPTPTAPEGATPEPTEQPRFEPWDSSWDTPERVPATSRGGETADALLVPPNLDHKGTSAYILKYGNERERSMMQLVNDRLTEVDVVKMDVDETGKLTTSDKGNASEGTASYLELRATKAKDTPRMGNASAWASRAVETDNGRFAASQTYRNFSQGAHGRKGFHASTFIHENLHTLTSRWVVDADSWRKLSNPTPEQKAVVKAVDELQLILKNMKTTAKTIGIRGEKLPTRNRAMKVEGSYGFSNILEFIAEMASEPFEKALKGLEDMVTETAKEGSVAEIKVLRTRLQKAMDAVGSMMNKILGKAESTSFYVKGYQAAVMNVIEATVAASKKANEDALAALKADTNPKLQLEKPPAGLDAELSPLTRAMDDVAANGPKSLEDFISEHVGGVTFDKKHGAFSIEAILQNPRMPIALRTLGQKLVGATTGFRGGEVVARNVWDDTVGLRDSQRAMYLKGHHLVFEKYWKKRAGSGFKAAVSIFEKEAARVEFNDAVYRAIASGTDHTDPFVKTAVEFNQKFIGDWVDRINNPIGDEGGVMKGLTETITESVDELTGEITRIVTGTLKKDPNYVPFQLNVSKLNEVFGRFGSKKVHDFMEEAFYKMHPELRAKALEGGKQYGKMFAEWYFKQVLDSKVNRKFDYLHSLETSADGADLTKSMTDAGIDPKVAEEIVASLLNKGEGTKAFNSSLRRRSVFDRQHSQIMEDGSELTMFDLIETDIGRVMDGYVGRMSGAVSLARNFDGVSSLSDITRLFQKAKERSFGENQLSDAQTLEVTNAFESAMAHILGRQVDDKSGAKLIMGTLRNLNVARLLGGSVLYQMMEVAQLIGTIGLRNTLRAMPEMVGNIRRNIETGKLNLKELNDYEDLMSGSGVEMLKYIEVQRGDEYQAFHGSNKWTKRADNVDFVMKKAASGLLKYTGMTGVTTFEKRLALVAITRHFQDVAVDGAKLGYNARRLATAGVSPEKYETMLAGMRQFSSKTSKGRHSLDVAGWAKADPDSFATWKVFLQRESRRTIQENDLGAHIPQLDNGWMKTFTQFRSFVLQAHSKALLFGVNHADAQTASTLMFAVGAGVIMQYGRAILKASTMEEEERKKYLDKALDFTGSGGVLARGVASISQAALMPQLIDTVSPFGNVFDGYRQTTDASDLWANPTADLVTSGFTAGKQVFQMATGQDSLDQRDARAIAKILPFNNAMGVAQALGHLTNSLPKHSKAELLFGDD